MCSCLSKHCMCICFFPEEAKFTMMFKVDYLGRKKYIRMNGVSFSSFIKEGKHFDSVTFILFFSKCICFF